MGHSVTEYLKKSASKGKSSRTRKKTTSKARRLAAPAATAAAPAAPRSGNRWAAMNLAFQQIILATGSGLEDAGSVSLGDDQVISLVILVGLRIQWPMTPEVAKELLGLGPQI
eukprot:Skav202201  [mRNA]  locus=scaffold2207:35142:35480:- [translate_table: standard]